MFAGSAALILALYALKAALRRLAHLPAFLIFATSIVSSVPMTWALSIDWTNPHVLPIANYVGNPIATLMVPCASYAVDRVTSSPSAFRHALELLVAVPLWFATWIGVEVLFLGWVRI